MNRKWWLLLFYQEHKYTVKDNSAWQCNNKSERRDNNTSCHLGFNTQSSVYCCRRRTFEIGKSLFVVLLMSSFLKITLLGSCFSSTSSLFTGQNAGIAETFTYFSVKCSVKTWPVKWINIYLCKYITNCWIINAKRSPFIFYASPLPKISPWLWFGCNWEHSLHQTNGIKFEPDCREVNSHTPVW